MEYANLNQRVLTRDVRAVAGLLVTTRASSSYQHLQSYMRCRVLHTCMLFWGYSNPLLSSPSYPATSTDGPPELPSCKAAYNELQNTFLVRQRGKMHYVSVIYEANSSFQQFISGALVA